MITARHTDTAPCSRVPRQAQVIQAEKIKEEKSMIRPPQLTAHQVLATQQEYSFLII